MMAAKRQYLPYSVPLIKRVFALSGDEVCRMGEAVFVNKKQVATARTQDSEGRSLPVWQGCITLTGDQFFALMDHPNSFDGRYFGPLNTGDVIGIATPLCVWPLMAVGAEEQSGQGAEGWREAEGKIKGVWSTFRFSLCVQLLSALTRF